MAKEWKTNLSPKKYIKLKVRTLPLGKCYINDNWESNGLAAIIITRRHPDGFFTCGMFLVDIWALGTKDCMYKIHIDKYELEEVKAYASEFSFVEIPYVKAHNIIYGANAFAEDHDVMPHPSFEIGQLILMDDTEDIPLVKIKFGKKGKFFLVDTGYRP